MAIEPNFAFPPLDKDNDYGIRYANFVAIIDEISRYLGNHSEKMYFTSHADFKNKWSINDWLKSDAKQNEIIYEMVIFISYISSNKEHIELWDNCSEQCISLYLAVTEKYIYRKYEGSSSNVNNEENINISNIHISSLDNRINSHIPVNKFTSVTNEEWYKELEEKIAQLNTLQRTHSELEVKYKESQWQISNFTANNHNTRILQEDWMNEQSINSKLKTELSEVKMTNDSLKKEYDEKIKSLNFKLSSANDKWVNTEAKLETYKSLAQENEKLKNKWKDLSLIKDKEYAISELEKNIESKNRIIESLNKEKEEMNNKIIKITSEIFDYKEQIREKDKAIRGYETEKEDLKKEIKRLDDLWRKDPNNSVRISSVSNTANVGGVNLAQWGQVEYENEIDDLNREISELKKEVEKYKNKELSQSSNKERNNGEQEKIFFEKEKLENEVQRLELEKQKIELEYESKVKQLSTEIMQLKNSNYSSSNGNKDDDGRKDVQKLKSQILKQEELIKALQDKIDKNNDSDEWMEGIDNAVDGDKSKYEIKRLKTEITNIQKEKDEMKARVNREHEWISSSLYEWAMQFMKFQKQSNDPLNKKSNYSSILLNSNQGNSSTSKPLSWWESERMKNFPSDKYQ